MDIKRAIFYGALLWVLIFFEVSILMFGFNLKEGVTYYVMHYILVVVLVSIAALLYFKGRVGSAKEGFAIGVFFVITGVFLDGVLTVPLFIKSYSFFVNPFLWIGLLETILVSTVIGSIKK